MSESLKSDKHDMLFMMTGPIGVRLRTLVSPRELRPIFEVRTRRQTFNLLLDEQPTNLGKVRTDSSVDAVRVGEVALDNSEIPLGDGSVCLARVEVEVDASVTSASSKLEGFVKAMEEALGLRPAAMSKYEAGLSVTGQNPNGEPSLKAKAESKGRKKR
jgi:triphosphatase